TATNEDAAVTVLHSFVENPGTSIRKVAQQQEVSVGSVHNILKKFHSYKIHLINFDRRFEFCELMMEKITIQPQFISNIVFTDEAMFELSDFVNRHNCRYGTDENPHWMIETHTQHPQKLYVWAGIIADTIIGYKIFFIEGNLTAEKYERMFRTEVVPAIQDIRGENFDIIWYQHDGAPHYGVQVRQYLNEVFTHRLIGSRGPIEFASSIS
ncbi:hypothetical protein X777_10256, partial [Ooceraea biroi]